MRITVVCSDEEYREIKKRAGLVPLSTWLKSLALNGIQVAELRERQEQALSNFAPKKSRASRKTEPVVETESGPETAVSNGSEPETATTAADWIETTVARRVGHSLGCSCYACGSFRRHLKTSQKPKKEPEEKKKGFRR